MRSVLLTAGLVAAAVVVPATPAAADHCLAYAHPPRAVGGQTVGEGVLGCDGESNLSIMVCVEAFRDGHWRIHTCENEFAYATSVTATAWACVQDAPLVRTYVLASDGNGEYRTAVSLPSLPGIGSCGP